MGRSRGAPVYPPPCMRGSGTFTQRAASISKVLGALAGVDRDVVGIWHSTSQPLPGEPQLLDRRFPPIPIALPPTIGLYVLWYTKYTGGRESVGVNSLDVAGGSFPAPGTFIYTMPRTAYNRLQSPWRANQAASRVFSQGGR